MIGGIVGTVDIGALLTKAIEIQKEQEETQKILDQIKNYISSQDGGYTRILRDYIKSDFGSVKDKILSDLQAGLRTSASLLRDQVMLGRLGYGGTSAMAGLYARLDATFRGLSTYTDALFGIPQEFLIDNARRYWSKELSPNPPNSNDALALYRHGYLSRAEWVKLKREEAGYTDKVADQIFSTLYKKPDEWTLFKLYFRKAISEDQLNEGLKILGWDPEKLDSVKKAFYQIPSFSDLYRLADYVPLDTEYISEILRYNGFREEDIPTYVSVIQRRPLREEVRSIAGRLLWEYSKGRITFDYLKDQLKDLGLLPVERTLYEFWATLQYDDTLMDLQIDIIEQKAKKRQYTTADEIKDDLVALGLDEQYSNLQAEKWYWEYIYTSG